MIADRHPQQPEFSPAPRVTCVRCAQPMDGAAYRFYPAESGVHLVPVLVRARFGVHGLAVFAPLAVHLYPPQGAR